MANANNAKIVLRLAERLRIKERSGGEYEAPKRGTRACQAGSVDKSLHVDAWTEDGFPCYTISGDALCGAHALFLHGGSYISEGLIFHRMMMERMVKVGGLRVTYVDYPLAPEHDAQKAHGVARAAYKTIAEKYPTDRFRLFGDSAGGGFALAFLQWLRDEGRLPFPRRTVLSSPWADVAMQNPEIASYEAADAFLCVPRLLSAAKSFAGGLPLTDPLLSPINGDLSRLGEVRVYAGTCEVFYPDCMLLYHKMLASPGTSPLLVTAEGYFHDWLLAPLKESTETADDAIKFLREGD